MRKRAQLLAGVLMILLATAFFALLLVKRRATTTQCGNHVISIVGAARIWANEHDGHLPRDLSSLSNEIAATEILICPGDLARTPANEWAKLSDQHSSYEIVQPGLKEIDRGSVYLRCKVQQTFGYPDGSIVVSGKKSKMKIP